MKRRFTILTAALALLVSLAIPMGVWGQTRDIKTDIMFAKGFAGYTTGSFSAAGTDRAAVANSTNETGVTYAMQVFNGSTGAVRGNQSGAANYSCRNTTTYDGYYISSVSLTITSTGGGTLDGGTNGRSIVYFGSTAYANPNTTAPSGTSTVASPNQSGQTTLTWTNTDESVSYFILYNLKTSGTVLSESSSSPLTVVWTKKTGPSIPSTTLTIDDTNLTNTDVYTSTEAGWLSATVKAGTETLSNPSISWVSSNEDVATIDEDGVVTLVAAGTVTITASYAGEPNVYGPSSNEYTLVVEDSTPFAGGVVTFVAGTDTGTSTGQNEDQMTKSGVTVHSTKAALATSEYRLYQNSITTISTTTGTITEIVFTGNSTSYSVDRLSVNNENGTYSISNNIGTWTGDATSVSFSASAQARASQISVTVVVSSAVATTTTINVPANFNTDIYQGTTAGTLTATVSAEGNPISGAIVTWSSSNTGVATIDANGAVTLVAVGTTIITANYAGVEDQYRPSTGTYELTVTDSNAPGTENNPYTVAQAIYAIDNDGNVTGVYATGIVSNVDYYSENNHYITYYISADGSTTGDQLEAYHGKGLNGADFSSIDDIQVGDVVVIYGNLTKYNSIYEFAADNELVSLVRPTNPIIIANDINLAYDATSGSIEYTISNPTSATLTATSNADWISNINVGSESVTFTTTANESDTDRSATITLSYTGATDKVVTVTQGHYVVDYAVLPFVWEGGSKTDFLALNGVSAHGLGSDYASGNAPYLIKLDNTGDYIQVKTASQPGKVTINVKMLGGANTSSITIQGSADGETFTDVEELTISGAQNDELTLETTNVFAANVRYVRMLFTKGSNVGVGPITIALPLTINGYGDNSNTGGYYLIASPFSSINPEDVPGMLSDTYDLYYFDQDTDGSGNEWINYKSGSFNLERGTGYLYAHNSTITLNFIGTPFEGNTYEVILRRNDKARFKGWNLVGNPFTGHAYLADNRDFYTMNADGSAFELVGAEDARHIEAMEGVFVIASSDEEKLNFTTTAPGKKGNRLALNLRQGNNVIDRAFIRFGECRQMPKLQFNQNSTKVYIPMDDEDYAVVRGEEMGEMPVNFKAESNGTYSLNFGMDNVEFAYLHLIDNLTGNDVDLLQTPSYSFEAKTTDYESRFKLVFATGDNSNEDNFAYFSNGSFVINNEGNATLQVIDITGRIVKCESINGCANVNVNAAPGVYMLRLVNGDNVKVQKVVVK